MEYLRREMTHTPNLDGNETDDVLQHNQKRILKNEGKAFNGIVRIGENYQATIPDMICNSQGNSTHNGAMRAVRLKKEGTCVWKTLNSCHLNNEEIGYYMNTAQRVHGYNIEQALGLLSYCKHDVVKASKELNNYMPNPKSENIWSSEDRVLFEDAFKVHGKDFVRIQQVLPHKSLQALVRYYYLSKKIIGRECKKRKKRTMKSANHKKDNHANGNGFKVDSKMNPQVNHYLQPTKKLVLAETRFQFNGQPIHNKDTPSSLQMKEGDIIEVGRVQTYFVPHIKQSLLTKISDIHIDLQKIKTMALNILGPDNVVVRFRTTKHSPLKNLMTRYCRRMNLPVASAHFRFDGVTVREHHTPASLNMNEEDNTINVFRDTRPCMSVPSLKIWKESTSKK